MSSPINPADTVLEMRNISKHFGGVCALEGVHFRLNKGEVHALVGENGAGKSTLMNILSGMIRQDSGEIFLKGLKIRLNSPGDALKKGIAMIHQELSLVPTVDVAENIWMGRERQFRRFGLLSHRKRYAATEQLLGRLSLNIPARAGLKDLSIANGQLVELALLYRIIRDLASRGISTVFISHKLDEIFEICDCITILRDGKHIATVDRKKATKAELVKWIVGREISSLFPKMEAQISGNALEVRDLCRQNAFENINFTVRRGEILGFCGLLGSGRTEIMRAIFGLDRFDSGMILIEGKPVSIISPRHAIAHGLGMVTEDRVKQGAVYTLPVAANMSLACLRKMSALSFIRFKQENAWCRKIADLISLALPSLSLLMKSLSGGNQQKAIIGRWLLTAPKVLILDEPTRGIDVGAKAEIHGLISRLAQQGMAIILVSSELPEILGMSDTIMVVRNGRIVHKCARTDANQETLIAHAFGT
jgi:inositol transport system ATP-binding protein